jgi:hypothetical protein
LTNRNAEREDTGRAQTGNFGQKCRIRSIGGIEPLKNKRYYIEIITS